MRKAMLVVAATGAAATLGVVTTTPATASHWNPSVLVGVTNATEPGIDIAPNGTMWVHAPTGVGSISFIWRSTNNGASWSGTTGLTRATGPGGGDIDLAVAPDTGRISYTDLWLGSAGVGYSLNTGDTWVAQPFSVPVQDRQWVSATNGGVVYHVTHQLESGIVVSKSVDGGLTYPVHNYAATVLDQGNCLCPNGPLVTEPGTEALGLTDKVGVAYTTGSGVRFSRSLDGGRTWLKPMIDPHGGQSTLDSFPVVVNAGNNVLHAVWLEVGSNYSRVMYSKSTNWGATWTAPSQLVNTGTPVFPWVAAKGNKVVVAFYHTTNNGAPDNVPTNSEWFVKSKISADGGATWGAIDTADTTVAKVGRVCTDGLACNGGREFGDYLTVAISPTTDKATIAYNRVAGGRQVRTVTES